MPGTLTSPYRGQILTLTRGSLTAEITSVGATLNRLVLEGRDLIVPGPLDEPMIGYRGAIIAPWPNRLGDGVYTAHGERFELPLNEHARRTALHGLVSFQDFTVSEVSADAATLTHRLVPTPGYPFPLEIEVRYALEEAGLVTTVRATNVGAHAAPYGVCPHPYLVAGPEPLDEWRVHVDAASVLEVDDRLLPVGTRPLTEHPELALDGAPLGARRLDHAYTDLSTGTVRLEAPGGTWVALDFDAAALPWVQVHTGDHENPEYHRRGLAVEPMTCPPDAFRSGVDLAWIAPGEHHEATWRLEGGAA
ncbi:MAG: aldose 1-epimerase family protein [Dermabacter sp.]|nr:aldose 1-epimerase family protein [Dermabacter sp.]